MSPNQILSQLVEHDSARRAEFDVEETPSWLFDELADAWRAAQAEAGRAYDSWRESPSRDAYIVYRAAQDRADQAQDELAARAAHKVSN